MQPQTAGIKISQFGYDSRTCPDYDLIFNSSWPSLAIVFDKTLTLTTDVSGDATIPHNLGFYPLSMAWQLNSTMSVSMGRIFPGVDKNNMYVTELTPNTTYYLNFKCYNLDITVPQQYTYLQPPAINTPYDNTYGIKVVKQNEQITSNDMRSFILHSRCASPQVLAVVTEKSASLDQYNQSVISYKNPQNYTPWAFGYAQLNGIYVWAAPVSQGFPELQFNTIAANTVSLNLNNGITTVDGSIIVLRDPLFAPNTVQATY